VGEPANHKRRPTFRVDFRPLPDSKVDSIVGLRRLMKRSLRAYGLVCVRVEELVGGVDPEVKRLQRIIESLAARCADQAEIITQLAEREEVRT
jgi:hypothetical protein